ncbi:hypothetical protein F2Q70_00029280 [Brassica cretica]|uniref:Uncharacterized protein n=1 Tax=Brassica cretica TaxID=69181 RepID=A0A8S9FBQ2_BRACR|nr:hypothetical protein F2Q70_00029280 [Brassica cretica]
MRDNFLDSELSALRNSEALFSTCSVSMTGTRLPDERAQAVRSLGSLLNYVRLDPRKGISIDAPFKISIDRIVVASIDAASRKLYERV